MKNNFKLPGKWMNIIIITITVLFFSQTLLFTLKWASPFVQADDWRFIKLYLRPLSEGHFTFQHFWADLVHPQPIYALFFVGSAQFFDLQMHYVGWAGIIFQFILGIVIAFLFLRSMKWNKHNQSLIILGVIALGTIIFSFIVHTPYTWPIMTWCFLSSLLYILIAHFSNNYLYSESPLNYKNIIWISLTLIIANLSYGDWALIFTISLIIVLFLLFWLEKTKRRKIISLSSILLISFVISYLFLTFYLIEGSRNNSYHIEESLLLILKNPLLSIKSISVALLSGILNLRWFSSLFDSARETYILIAIVFLINYLFVLFLFFKKKLYHISIIPATLMIYTLIYIFSILVFRYNPIDNGIFCLYWVRYVQFFQIGIIGYLWTVFLIFNTQVVEHPKVRKKIMILSFSLTLLLFVFWINDYKHQHNIIIPWFKNIYPSASSDIRNKLNDKTVKIPGIARPASHKINTQLEYIYEHKLNVFSPDYPYPIPKKD
ncbi:MAG: hypothetical protein GQ527_08985 [Bacteroidales bacterium]|nr:hypothetical protein [Bacteroidales bacterium]